MADNFDYNLIAYIGRKPDFLKEITIEWNGNTPTITFWDATALGKVKPTIDQLNALESEATTLENNAKIDAKRQTEYLSWQEQFEMIYKDEKNGTTTYKDHCDKVRSDNPKE